MPSKKQILQKLGELKSQMKQLEEDINNHYIPENTIIENEFSDLKARILSTGWATLEQEGISITLGKYPNARFKILEEMFEKFKGVENSK